MPTALTRRELLAAFLGMPLALQGCQSSSPRAIPPGELVGTSATIGHRIRDGLKISVADDRWENHKVVIVGGGIAGLSAARRLKMSGIDDFVLIELEPEPGGTSRSGDSDVVPFPWGAHYVPAPTKENRALVGLLDELNVFEGRDEYGDPVVAEQFLCRYPQERVFYRGHWYEGLYLHAGATDDDLQQFGRFQQEINRWIDWRDSRGLRAFAIPIATASDDTAVTELDKITMSAWMRQHGFTSSRLRWYVDLACRDDYGMTIDQTSAWAGVFYFAARVPEVGRKSRPFITWPEGNGRLVSHMFDQVKQQSRLGLAVADVNPKLDRQDGSRVEITAVSADGNTAHGFRAEHVIFAAPHFLARYLIRAYRENPPEHVAEFEYGSWMVANLRLRDRPRSEGFPLCWDNVFYESPSVGYVTATHQRGMDYGPTILTYYYPLCEDDHRAARRKLLSIGRDEWADIVLTDLQQAHPDIRDLTERLDVMRWGHAMIRPKPGFISGAARTAAAKPFGNIHFAHSDLSGIALFEEAFYRGTLAAEQVLESASISYESIL